MLSGPGVLYHVPIACTNAARPSEELFPDLHDFPRSDFGLGDGRHEKVMNGRMSTGSLDWRRAQPARGECKGSAERRDAARRGDRRDAVLTVGTLAYPNRRYASRTPQGKEEGLSLQEGQLRGSSGEPPWLLS